MPTRLLRLFRSHTWLVMVLLLLLGRSGQAQNWDAAQALGTSEFNGQATGYKTLADGAGHLFLTGSFGGTISLGGRTLSSPGQNSFIARLDATTGQCQWALIGVNAADMALDASGDLYVAGSFTGPTLTLGATTLTNTCTNPYGSDLFVAKLSSAGQWQWAYQASGPGNKYATHLALDAAGNVYLTGSFGTGATFGATALTSAGSDIFVAKITAAGQWQWAVKAGSEKMNYTNGLRADASGNVYVAGAFYGSTASFGTISLTNTSNVMGSGVSDIFVAKLNTNGQWLWAVQAGGYDSDNPAGLTLDAAGNAYLAGYAMPGVTTFGSISLNIDYAGAIFAAKLSPAGQWLWVTPATGGSGTKTATALATDAAGNTYLTGFTHSTQLSFGSISLTGSGPNQRTYVAKINTSGQWQWATQTGGAGGPTACSLAVDASSNVFLTGFYGGDDVTFGTTTLNNSGALDLFVAKLNGTGQWQWATQTNDGGSSTVSSTAVDAAGNVYVSGSFTGTLSFGSLTRTSRTADDLFVAKRNAAGQWLWVTQTAGNARYGYYGDKSSLAVDAAGNVYLAGCFRGSAATFGATTLSSIGFDIFVAKLNTAGQWQWATQVVGDNDEFGTGIAVDAAGRAYVTGSFRGATATFGTTTLTNPGTGASEVFAAKLDPDGQWLWASRGGGAGNDVGTDIALDALGNAYVSGITLSPAASFGSATISNPGYANAFVAKLSSTGQWQWAADGGSGYAGAEGIAADASGNAYVTGFFSGAATFGSTAFTSNDSSDVFVAKINTTGQWQWAAQGGMRGSNQGTAIAVDATGNAYVMGSFRSAGGIFGAITLPFSRRSYYDTFVAQLGPAGQWQWAASAGGVNYSSDLALSPSGQVYVAGEFSGQYGSATATFGPLTLTSPGPVHSVGYLARLSGISTSTTLKSVRTMAQAFPNPFAGPLSVRLAAAPAGPLELTVQDAVGRQWLHKRLTTAAGQSVLALPEAARWPAGLYLLTVRQGESQQVLKLVKQ